METVVPVKQVYYCHKSNVVDSPICERSRCWMLNTLQTRSFGANDSGDNRKDNGAVPSNITMIIDNFLKDIAKGDNGLLKKTQDKIKYITQVPGFVKTIKALNQSLHLNSENVVTNDPFYTLILHVPLSLEGMWLQLDKINKKIMLRK